MQCPSCEQELNLPPIRLWPRMLDCPGCGRSLKFYLRPKDRMVWTCLAVFFLTVAGMFVWEGWLLLTSRPATEVVGEMPKLLPVFFFISALIFLALGSLFLLLFEKRLASYVTADDPIIGFRSALRQLPLGLAAIALGALLALPVVLTWGPNKHWALTMAAGCSTRENPPSAFNRLCLSTAQALILTGADPNYYSPIQGFTPLMVALGVDNRPMVYYLLDQGADVNQMTRFGGSPMFLVVRDPELFDLFLEHGGKVTLLDNGGRNLLWHAAVVGNLTVIKKLMALGNRVDHTDRNGVTPLMAAAAWNHPNVVETLIQSGADINRRSRNGSTPLILTGGNRDWRVAQVLMDHGADVNLANRAGWTALHAAAVGGRVNTVALLLKHGAVVDPADYEGRTPLTLAVKTRHEAIADRLLAGGADVNRADGLGWTPLHWAVRPAGTETGLVKLLLRYRANVHARGVSEALRKTLRDNPVSPPRDHTPLHLAAEIGEPEIIHLLIQAGADPNAVTGEFATPLSLAAKAGREPAVRQLLEDGALANFPGQKQTPLHLAVVGGHLDLARLLVQNGADPSMQNADGKTPLDLALEQFDDQKRVPWLALLSPPPAAD